MNVDEAVSRKQIFRVWAPSARTVVILLQNYILGVTLIINCNLIKTVTAIFQKIYIFVFEPILRAHTFWAGIFSVAGLMMNMLHSTECELLVQPS
jgi:hypothetical protein